MKKDKKYGEFSYRSRKFRKSLAFLCLTALLVPSASFGVNAAETAGQNAAQAAGGWVTDTESAVQGQGLQFSIPQISVYYGQQLKDAYLSGTATDALGQTVRGTFSWVYPETVLDKVGTVLAEAVFTPAAEMPVTETPAAEVSAAGTPVGQEGWASAEISAGTDASAPLPKQYLSVNVTVEPAPVDVVEDPWTATPLKEGLLLKDIRLEGGKAVTGYPAPYTETDGTETVVSGSFSWADPDAVLTAGRQEVTVIFTPDQKEYRTAKTVLTLEAEETEEPEQPEKPQMPQLYLSCPDIFYGEKAEAKALADKLEKESQGVHMPAEYILNDTEFYETIKKMMAHYDCNAFTIPCFEVCATRELNRRRLTFCLAHSLFKDEGIASACAGDVGSVLTITILMNIARKAPYMGNTMVLDKNTNQCRTLHDVACAQMKGYDEPALPTEFVSFTMDSWGTTMRYDFSKDNGETLTMINMSPDMKKIMVAKGTINGCDDYLTPECKHAVRYTVKDAKRFHECQKFVGHHFALVYGDYVEEVKAFAKECDLEVLEA